MASYNPPNEYITVFNTNLFNQPEDTLSIVEGNQLYLSKKVSDTSTAPLTTFQSQVVFNTDPPISNSTPSLSTHLATLGYLASTYLTQAIASTTYMSMINSVAQSINGVKTFTGTIKSNNYEADSITTNLNIGANVTSGDIRIGRTNKTSVGEIGIGTTASQFNVYSSANFGNFTAITDGQTFQARIIRSSSQALAHYLFDDMGTGGVLTIGNPLSTNSIRGGTTFTSCPSSNIAPTLAEHLTRRDFVLGQGFTTLALVQANANTFSSTTTFSVIPICSVNASANNQLVNWQTLNAQGFTTLALVQSNANTFTSTTTFSVIPICSINATANNQLVNWQTLNGQGFTTLSLVQSNNNIWTGTNQFNQSVKIQYAAAQYTDLEQSAQAFNIFNRSASGSTYIRCRDAAGITDSVIAQFQTSGVSLGLSSGSNTISGNNTTFNSSVSITGTLTAGTALLGNTISGDTTFNQAVSVSGTASVSGVLTATTSLKTGDIVPNISTGQNNIYTNMGVGGTIFFGMASRTMNIYGNVNMVNSCQFSGFLLTNDISFASGQGGTAKTIYTSLTTGGSITLGATTANTTTNIRGGAISIGGASNALTIDSSTTFNSTLKTDDITAITTTATQSIYTTLASTGVINMGATTAGTITNIYGGAINIGNSASALTIDSPATFNNTLQTDDITAITTSGTQNIYTTLIASGTINLGSATANTTTNVTGGFLNLGSTNFDTRINSTITNFTSNGALSIGASVAPASFSFFSTLVNTTINFFNGLTSGTINFCSSTTMNTMFNLNARVKLRTYKLVDELQTLTLTSHTLGFPLEETTLFTNTANITVTLPEITNDAQLGLIFWFINLGSITTTTTFVRQGTNLIIPIGQMTQFTSSPIINNTKTCCSFVIVKLSGIYIWAESNF